MRGGKVFQEPGSSQRLQSETERRQTGTASCSPKARGDLVAGESTQDGGSERPPLHQPKAHLEPISRRCPEGGAVNPASAHDCPPLSAAAGAPRSLSRRPAGGAGGATPGRGRPDPGAAAPSAHPEAAAARRAPGECTARRAAGREARRGREGGSRREPPPLAARVPAGRMGRFEPGSRAGSAPSSLLPWEASPDTPRTPSCREDDHGRGQERTGGPAEHVSGEYCPAVQW